MRHILTRPGTYTWAICDRCQGNGSIVNPSIDGHGLSREDFDEDPDFEEDYFAGVYDVCCPDCEGGRTRVPNVARMNFTEKRALVLAYRHAEWDAESRAEQRRESMMLGEY